MIDLCMKKYKLYFYQLLNFMKKHFYTFCSIGLLSFIIFSDAFGQSAFQNRFQKSGKAERKTLQNILTAQSTNPSNLSTNPGNSTTAIGELRFTLNPEGETGSFGIGGVCYLKGYFYFTKFSSADTLIIYDSTGTFVQKASVPNINRVRSLTTDGTFLYGTSGAGATGTLSRTVTIINPVTRTRLRSFQVPPTIEPIRWITYNPEGNAGAGSFFCGNFDTPIYQINKPAGASASLVNSIPASVHGLTSMYGVAYDANGANSSFWVNDQGTSADDETNIVQLNAAGAPTGITLAAHLDAPNGIGTAAGISVANISEYPGKTLLSFVQFSGLVAYNITPAQVEVSVDSISVNSNLAAWPSKVQSSQRLMSKFRSFGAAPVSNLTPKIEVSDFETEDLVETLNLGPVNLTYGQSATFQTALGNAAYENGKIYLAQAIVTAAGDAISENDTNVTIFGITDSTYAKSFSYLLEDFTSSVFGVGGNASSNKAVGTKFKIDVTDTLTSISYFLGIPSNGQPSSASVYRVINGVIASTPLATTSQYIATADDEADGVLVTVPFSTPVRIPAGEFLVSVNELGDSTLGIFASTYNYKQNTTFIKFAGNPSNGSWVDVHIFNPQFGLRDLYSIYPNFGKSLVSSTQDQIAFKGVTITPNPTSGKVRIFMEVPNNQEFALNIVNALGKKIEVPSAVKFNNRNLELDFKNQEAGVYFISLSTGSSKKTLPLVLTK